MWWGHSVTGCHTGLGDHGISDILVSHDRKHELWLIEFIELIEGSLNVQYESFACLLCLQWPYCSLCYHLYSLWSFIMSYIMYVLSKAFSYEQCFSSRQSAAVHTAIGIHDFINSSWSCLLLLIDCKLLPLHLLCIRIRIIKSLSSTFIIHTSLSTLPLPCIMHMIHTYTCSR